MVSHESLPQPLLAVLIAVLGLAAAAPAAARLSYCCNDAAGKLTCGDMVPGTCYNRAYRVFDEKGRLVREVEAPLSPEQRSLREAEKVRKAEEAKRLAEEKRRNQALLSTYSSEKDIDAARERALADFDKASADTRKRHEAAVKAKKKLDVEKEFFQKKPMPANLKKQVEDNESDLKTLQAALDARQQERDALAAKFDEEKKRYVELRYGKTMRSADALPAPAPAPAPAPGPAYKAYKPLKSPRAPAAE
jgi:hypothetical protein